MATVFWPYHLFDMTSPMHIRDDSREAAGQYCFQISYRIGSFLVLSKDREGATDGVVLAKRFQIFCKCNIVSFCRRQPLKKFGGFCWTEFFNTDIMSFRRKRRCHNMRTVIWLCSYTVVALKI